MPRKPLFTFALHRPHKARAEMAEELRVHVEEMTDRLQAAGYSQHDARAEAIRRLGPNYSNTERSLGDSAEHRERTLGMRDWLIDLGDDIRYAIRGLRRRPGFTAVAIITLAIGIGGNTAIYSAVDALLLRSLPFREPDRLMDIGHTQPSGAFSNWSAPQAKVFRDAQTSYSSVALFSGYPITLTGDNPERIGFETVTALYLSTLGVNVAKGSDFKPEIDAGAGVGAFAIISDALWKRRYDGADNVIGKSVSLDNKSYEIVGVLPPSFRGVSGNADVMVNLTSRDAQSLAEPWSMEFDMIGRLKPGIAPEQAMAETKRVGRAVYEAFPRTPGQITSEKSQEWGAAARPLDSVRVAGLLKRSLYILFGAVGLVLLIACVNLANLLLARASARKREIAVRLAIGASRGRLIRLMLTESLVLATGGGLAGVTFAWWATRLLSTLNPAEDLRAQNLATQIGAIGFSGIRLDASALLFTFGVTIAVGLIFGLVPALGGSKADLTVGLKDDGAAGGQNRRLGIDRRALVVAEVALSIVLLAGSGLMMRSLAKLMHVDPGFDATNVLTLKTNVPAGTMPRDSLAGFYQSLRDRLAAVPGVQSAAISDCPPVSGGCNGTLMTFPDQPKSATGNAIVGVHWVSPDWFATMRIPLKSGRMFTDADRQGTQKVVLLNEAAVKAYFKGENPVGRQVAIWQGGFNTGAEVIGVVADVRFQTMDVPSKPDAYISYAQSPAGRATIFLRTGGDPVAVAPSVRAALKEVAPFAPVYDMRTMTSRVATATGQARLSATLLAAFAAVALALAVMGIYGVMSFSVAQRTREIGIRVALGADRQRVLGLFTREGLTLSGLGIVVGLGAAFALTRVMRALLFNVAPTDGFTFVAIAVVALIATLVASWIPARRAAALDPVRALK